MYNNNKYTEPESEDIEKERKSSSNKHITCQKTLIHGESIHCYHINHTHTHTLAHSQISISHTIQKEIRISEYTHFIFLSLPIFKHCSFVLLVV